MAYDASRHFEARPAPGGGVRLTMRTRFRDVGSNFSPPSGAGHHVTEIDEDGVARTRPSRDEFLPGGSSTTGASTGITPHPQKQLVKDANGDEWVRTTVFTFTPAKHEEYEFEERDAGVVAVVLSTPASDYPGAGTGPSTQGTTDARARFVASGQGSTATKLKALNTINRRVFRR